jgi:glycosyltransferase involved in cell wall biosynthesis
MMRHPTVLHIGASLTLDSVVFHQLIGLRDKDWAIVIACAPDKWSQRLVAVGFSHVPIRIGAKPSNMDIMRGLADIPSAIRRVRPDLIHTHNAHHGVIARLVAAPMRIPTVHTWRYSPMDAASSRSEQVAYAAAEGVAARACRMVLFQNREDLRDAVRSRIVPRHKALLVGNGIRLELYGENTEPPSRVRAQLGLEGGSEIVLCVGRLEERKRQADLIAALPLLLRDHPSLHVLLVGPGTQGPELEAKARELGVDAELHVLGHRSDIPSLLGAADVLVLPSRREGVPRAVMEAMAARVPVVATDVVGTREVVHDRVTGLTVPYADPPALARAIHEVLADESLARALVENAYDNLVRNFREEHVIDRIDRVYRSILEGQR